MSTGPAITQNEECRVIIRFYTCLWTCSFFYKREHAVFRLLSREHPDFSPSFIPFFTIRRPRYGPAQLLLSLQHDSPRLHQRLNIWTGRTACVKKGITMSFALTREGIKPVAKGFALALALFQIWFTTGFGVLDGSMMRVMFVSFITVLVFMFIPCRKYKENEKEPTLFLLIDLCCAGLAIATAVYFALHLTEITTRMRYIDDVTPAAKFFAAATVLLVLEITRRTTGWALVIVASTLILYAFFGDMLPRAVKHTGFTFDVIVEHLFLLNEGVYGIPIGVATSTLFGFIMFGAFLERSKMSSIFMDLRLPAHPQLAGRARQGRHFRLGPVRDHLGKRRRQRLRDRHLHHPAHEEGRLPRPLRRRGGSRRLHRRAAHAPGHGDRRLPDGGSVRRGLPQRRQSRPAPGDPLLSRPARHDPL